MNRSSQLWLHLAPDVTGLLGEVGRCIEAQRLSGAWTQAHLDEARRLLAALALAWAQERVELDTLRALKALSGQLDLSGLLTCRAALEAVQGHLRRIVEVTAEDLVAHDVTAPQWSS